MKRMALRQKFRSAFRKQILLVVLALLLGCSTEEKDFHELKRLYENNAGLSAAIKD